MTGADAIVHLAKRVSAVSDVDGLISALCETFGVEEGDPGARLAVPPRYLVLGPGTRPGVVVLGPSDEGRPNFLSLNLGAGGPAGWVAPEGLEPGVEAAAVGIVGLAVSRLLLRARVDRDHEDLVRLARIAEIVSSSVGLDQLLHDALEHVRSIIPYDAAGIYVVEADKTIVAQSTVGYGDVDPALLSLKIGQGIVGYAVSSGRTVIVPDVSQDARYVNARPATKSEIACPLAVGGRVVGALNLESDAPSAFNRGHVELATSFAAYVAAVVERSRLYDALVEKQRIENELAIARRIQFALLSNVAPPIPGFEVAVRCTPSAEVGGDYVGFVPIVQDQWGIAVADVSGKGVPAAIIMATFRASLLAEIRNEYAIRTIMSKVNALLVESVEPWNFVTAAYGVLDSRARLFTYSNAGHEPPLVVRADDHVEVLVEGGLPLGAFHGSAYGEQAIGLRSGDQLLMYTDGITDPGPEGGLSEGQLADILRRGRTKSADEVLEEIDLTAAAVIPEGEKGDDRTMLLLRTV